ncbi:MAG: hypothetical protein R2849_01945 [Thermomicrobiales bacterium]
MWSFPTLEPVVLTQGSFAIERVLSQAGEVVVSVGASVDPDEVIARSEDVEQTMTLYVASELGVESEELSKYVAKSIGSSIRKGEVIARVRRGLRTATVKSPVDGTLVSVDDSSGTVVVSSSLGKRDLLSLVSGEVERVIPNMGAIIRTSGTRLYGIAGFGTEAIGSLVVGTDRPDRELTADNVPNDWKGKIVLAGMTAGVPALTRLVEVGAAGVILASIPEGDLRRFLSGGQMDQDGFWNPVTAAHGDLSHPSVDSPLVIIVTEGFGRRPMSDRMFEILRGRSDQIISVSARTSLGNSLARPEIYLDDDEGTDRGIDDRIVDRRPLRIVDSGAFSVPATAAGEPYVRPSRFGVREVVVNVFLESGQTRTVPTTNVEVIE